MIAGSALFLRERIEPDVGLFSAMTVPLDLVQCESDIQASLRGTGFINGNRERRAIWKRLREIDGNGISRTDSLRFGQNVDIVQIESDLANVVSPCFLLPEIGERASKRRIVVELRFGTSFETAGAQGSLWIALYCEIKYESLMGTVNREFIADSRIRKFLPGDSFTIECHGGSRRAGVLILEERLSDLRWASSLYLADDDGNNIIGSSIVSFDCACIDGYWATFRRVFGTVQEVGEYSTLI